MPRTEVDEELLSVYGGEYYNVHTISVYLTKGVNFDRYLVIFLSGMYRFSTRSRQIVVRSIVGLLYVHYRSYRPQRSDP